MRKQETHLVIEESSKLTISSVRPVNSSVNSMDIKNQVNFFRSSTLLMHSLDSLSGHVDVDHTRFR
jgi:hypothetical protein